MTPQDFAIAGLALTVFILGMILLGRYLAYCRESQSFCPSEQSDVDRLNSAIAETRRTGRPVTAKLGSCCVTVSLGE